jgi:hypothetical protein
MSDVLSLPLYLYGNEMLKVQRPFRQPVILLALDKPSQKKGLTTTNLSN